MTDLLPHGLTLALEAQGIAPATDERIARRLSDEGGTPHPNEGAVIRARTLLARYGFALPRPLESLLEVADAFMLEDAKMPSLRFVRVAPGGWEPPPVVEGEELALTFIKRFDWNTFSNMQLWERFSGTAPLGWDPMENRFAVATTRPDAPVFWLNHETAEIHGAVASLEGFLRAQLGMDGVSERERHLSLAPDVWSRDSDGLEYLGDDGPLTAWPPFLSARADWIVACLKFGQPEGMLERFEVQAFDLGKERESLGSSEPLALYWLLRSFFLDERDVFDEVKLRASSASPLAASFARLCEARWSASPETSMMAKVRARLRGDAPRLRKPRWPRNVSRENLV